MIMNRSAFRFFHPYRVRYSEIDGQALSITRITSPSSMSRSTSISAR